MTELTETKHAGLNAPCINHTTDHSINRSSIHKAVLSSHFQRLLILTVID